MQLTAMLRPVAEDALADQGYFKGTMVSPPEKYVRIASSAFNPRTQHPVKRIVLYQFTIDTLLRGIIYTVYFSPNIPPLVESWK